VLAVGAWVWPNPGAEAGAPVAGGGNSAKAIDTKSVNVVHSADVNDSPAIDFSIAGDMHGLFPGATLPLELTVYDRLSVPIVVSAITTRVASVTRSCAASNVIVTSFSGQLPVAAHRSTTVAVNVVMMHSTPNACQSGRFIFLYRGLANTK
jgi:hypothetical protein